MKSIPNCVKCGCAFTYENGNFYICPECGHEWIEAVESEGESQKTIVRDAHGNALQDGDSVVIVKDIKVKGSSSAIKIGLKVKDIRLVEEVNGHNLEAKVPGFGLMMLKSEVVKKCND